MSTTTAKRGRLVPTVPNKSAQVKKPPRLSEIKPSESKVLESGLKRTGVVAAKVDTRRHTVDAHNSVAKVFGRNTSKIQSQTGKTCVPLQELQPDNTLGELNVVESLKLQIDELKADLQRSTAEQETLQNTAVAQGELVHTQSQRLKLAEQRLEHLGVDPESLKQWSESQTNKENDMQIFGENMARNCAAINDYKNRLNQRLERARNRNVVLKNMLDSGGKPEKPFDVAPLVEQFDSFIQDNTRIEDDKGAEDESMEGQHSLEKCTSSPQVHGDAEEAEAATESVLEHTVDEQMCAVEQPVSAEDEAIDEAEASLHQASFNEVAANLEADNLNDHSNSSHDSGVPVQDAASTAPPATEEADQDNDAQEEWLGCDWHQLEERLIQKHHSVCNGTNNDGSVFEGSLITCPSIINTESSVDGDEDWQEAPEWLEGEEWAASLPTSSTEEE